MKEYKEIPFVNSNLKELLKDLRKRLEIYDGRYKTKQFKEWVESLLMLETDILNDGTYNDSYYLGQQMTVPGKMSDMKIIN